MVFSVTFNNISVISWRSALLVEETGGPRENHRPVASHGQTLSHNLVHFGRSGFELTVSLTYSILLVIVIEKICHSKSDL